MATASKTGTGALKATPKATSAMKGKPEPKAKAVPKAKAAPKAKSVPKAKAQAKAKAVPKAKAEPKAKAVPAPKSVPPPKVKGPASYFPSIEKTYGKPISAWLDVLAAAGARAHMELVALLKSAHGLGHGHANALVAHFLGAKSK